MNIPFFGKNEPVITIVMNCFNGDKYLREAMDSVLNQTYPHWKLLFWDNHSTDQSAAIAKSYKDSRIQYIYAPKHTRLGEARNLAMELAKTEWVCFFDTDDVWLPHKLELQAALIMAKKDDPRFGIVYGRTIVLRADGKEEPYYFHPEGKPLPEGNVMKPMLELGNIMPLVSVVFRREGYWKAGGIPNDYNYAVDYHIFTGLADIYTAAAVQEPVCKYRLHGSSATANMTDKSWQEVIDIVHRWKRYLDPVTFNRKVREYATWQAVAMARRKRFLDAGRHLFSRGSVPYLASQLADKAARLIRY